ncbi:MAG: NAD-dependent dehydratase, partial [Candidatus Eremiobacteraeota bacterium]|nr:NAD-dependent dehydratase [Candidatus Eremiobacteraeota bacterium]
MRLLILGGYRFVGRAIIDLSLSRGHAITAFNRGGHVNADLPVELVRGDRMCDLDKLRGRNWDAVIDTCA